MLEKIFNAIIALFALIMLITSVIYSITDITIASVLAFGGLFILILLVCFMNE